MLSKARKDTTMRNTRGHVLAVFFAILFLVVCGTSRGQVTSPQGPVPSRITAPVDDTLRVSVAKSTHPQAQARFDRGPVDPGLPMERMLLVLGVSPEQDHQLRTFLDSQQTAGSPDYHHWLTPEEFGQKFGPSSQDIQQVTAWLQQQGFRVGPVAKSGRWLEFSGNAAQVQAAFQTQMRTYQVGGQMHLANASDISIPAALAPVVRGVASLHDFVSKPMHIKGSMATLRPDATLHDSQGNVVHALSPGDFALIYNLMPLYSATPALNGTGQTIAIVARSNIDTNDISAFQAKFNLSPKAPNIILDGPDPGFVPGDQDEATLDVEWSGGVAPGATIDVVVSSVTASTDGVDLSAAYIVDNNLAQVMSTSFNQCERLLGPVENAFFNSLWEQAAAQGISVFVSSGDDGAAGCDDPTISPATGGLAVGGLSSTPFNTAVGGTEFDEALGGGDATFWNTTNALGFVSVKGYIPEMVWNESCSTLICGTNANLFAGSGGQSTIYVTPSWQSASLGIPGLNQLMRVLPDVSLAAAGHDGYLVCLQGSCQAGSFFVFGGTSASSPSFAAIMAIIDQKIGKPQGLANYVLYKLAQSESFSNCNSSNRTTPGTPTACVFNDSTVGNNSVPGQTGFNAVTGYDLATGLGSVDATNLANAWPTLGSFQGTTTTLTTTATLPITITHGASLNFNVAVARSGATGTPSGTIALIASGGNITGSVGVAATTISPGSPAGTANGAFTGISNLPGGTAYNLVAHYPGDGTFGASDSNALTVNVTQEISTTTLTSIVNFDSNGNPITGTTIAYGGFLDLRTVVASTNNTSPPDGFPSGKITINDNNVASGTLALNAFAQAELINCSTPALVNPVCLTVGSHPISISYAGDNGFSGSTSSVVTITVTKGNPGVAAIAPATANFNTPITVQASVFPTGTIFPTGTVRFFQGTTQLGSPLTLTPGSPSTASAQVTLSGTGNQTVTVQYSGDATYNSATSPPSTVNVTPPFNFSATTTSATIAAGATATYNITLNAVGGFTGSVSLACSGAPVGSSCTVSPNPAVLGTSDPLTVTVSNTANARLAPAPFRTWPLVFAGALAGLLWGVRRKPRPAKLIALAVGLVVVVGVGSCGGSKPPPPPPPPPTFATLNVTGTSGQATNSITLSLTVTH
jgi:hypothetical protein